MNRSEFFALTRRANEIISKLALLTNNRQRRKELRNLARIIDDLENLQFKGIPFDWKLLANSTLFIIELIKKFTIS